MSGRRRIQRLPHRKIVFIDFLAHTASKRKKRMIHSKGANGSTAELVWTQILQGIGGGASAVLCQTAAQASVAHQDLAAVTAFVLLLAEIGNAIGTAAAASIWRQQMPGALQSQLEGLPGVNQTTIDGIYANIVSAALYPADDPIRRGTILA